MCFSFINAVTTYFSIDSPTFTCRKHVAVLLEKGLLPPHKLFQNFFDRETFKIDIKSFGQSQLTNLLIINYWKIKANTLWGKNHRFTLFFGKQGVSIYKNQSNFSNFVLHSSYFMHPLNLQMDKIGHEVSF